MSVTIGSQLGTYEITALLGKGGFGEVYRAKDKKLKRDVAIKILPDEFSGNSDRLIRFQREAEVLASLNHPNIAAIYDLATQDQSQFLVLELVDGETLADRIARGPIPLEEALNIAKQICEALEAAHEKGVIHRDLKPANIKISPDGKAKVLDFGLAKIRESSATSNLSNSPTLVTAPTSNVILGTASYMSPEQARGKAADRATDIWAFGCVLYEMLTGHQVFEGETVGEVLAEIFKSEPDWLRLPANTPSNVRRLLRRCLRKDVNQRFRDARDVRIEIEEAVNEPETVAPPSQATRRSRFSWIVAAVLFLALGLALWAPWRAEEPVDRPLVRLDVDLGEDTVLPSANDLSGSNIAISPDGTRLLYVSGTPKRLFTRRLDQPKAAELPGTQEAVLPFFSPDGLWVGFWANHNVNKISVEGGSVVSMGEVVNFAGASWFENGSIFASEAYGKGLLQLPAAGGSPKIVTPLGNGEVALALPQVLPGGKAILFAACGSVGVINCNVEVLTLADGRRKVLARGGHSPHYLPSWNWAGHLIYINKATLFAIPFDPATLETRGTAVPVLDDIAYAPRTGAGLFDVSGTGTLIYRRSRGDADAMATLQWVDSAGRREPVRDKSGGYVGNPALSPDGKRIALTIFDRANQDIWVYDPQRNTITRLTFGEFNSSPVWSPDGQYVVFAKLAGGIFQARADGASPPQALIESKTPSASLGQVPSSFTPDGKRLAYFEFFAGHYQIWTVPLENQGGQLKAGKPEQFLKSNFQDTVPSFSPDGRWLAYQSNESGAGDVYVRAFPLPSSGQGGKWQISNSGGSLPHWSRSGHELLYRSGDQIMAVSYSVKDDAFVAEKPRVWLPKLGGTAWDLVPDGKRVAVLIPEGATQAVQADHGIVMLQNFFDELRRIAPPSKK
jgi:serine/threonine-protein kinase